MTLSMKFSVSLCLAWLTRNTSPLRGMPNNSMMRYAYGCPSRMYNYLASSSMQKFMKMTSLKKKKIFDVIDVVCLTLFRKVSSLFSFPHIFLLWTARKHSLIIIRHLIIPQGVKFIFPYVKFRKRNKKLGHLV